MRRCLAVHYRGAETPEQPAQLVTPEFGYGVGHITDTAKAMQIMAYHRLAPLYPLRQCWVWQWVATLDWTRGYYGRRPI